MNSSTAGESHRIVQLRKRLPAVLALVAFAAIALRLASYPPSTNTMQVSLALLTVFGAALLSSIAGFAFSAIAAGVLTHLYADPAEMVRTLLVCSIAIQIYCSARVLRAVRWRELAPYVAGGIATAPLGVLILSRASPDTYALTLGLLLLAYAGYASVQPCRRRIHRRPAIDFCIGALGGITGGVAASPGAIAAAWCSAQALSKERQRAICQPYIFIVQLVALAWLHYLGLGATREGGDLWPFIPVALLGAHLGYSIFQRISTEQFRGVVLVLLGFSGAVLVVTAR
jgi:uncharacterized membrane protein YfcA